MMFFLSLDLHALSHVLMSFIWWIDRLNSVQNERFMHFSYPLKWSLNFLFEFHNEKFFIRALIVLWEHQNSNNLICWIQSFNLRRFRIWCTYCSRIYLYLCKYWMKYFMFWIRGHPKSTKERYKPYLSVSILFQWTTYNHSRSNVLSKSSSNTIAVLFENGNQSMNSNILLTRLSDSNSHWFAFNQWSSESSVLTID